MAGYVNTLAIVATNSLINNQNSFHATPVLKAVVRDLKRFLVLNNNNKGTRILPVGFSPCNAEHINRQPGFLEYLCFGAKESTIDFLGASDHARCFPGSETLTAHSPRIMDGRGRIRTCRYPAGTP